MLIAAKDGKQDKISIDKQTDWARLLNGGRLAVGDPDHVPAGIYAKEALQNLGAWPRWNPSWREQQRAQRHGAGGAR